MKKILILLILGISLLTSAVQKHHLHLMKEVLGNLQMTEIVKRMNG